MVWQTLVAKVQLRRRKVVSLEIPFSQNLIEKGVGTRRRGRSISHAVSCVHRVLFNGFLE